MPKAAAAPERTLVVVDADVDHHIGESRVPLVRADDEQRRRLLAAAVAPSSLSRIEAVEQALRQRLPRCRLERLGDSIDGLRGDEDVPLRRVAVARPMAGPVVAFGAGERRGASLGVDDPELAMSAIVVRGCQSLDDFLGREPFPQQCEPVRAVARIRVRLRRDGADERLRPRDDGADGEELRLDGDAPVPRLEVARADRVRRDDHASHRSAARGRRRGERDPRPARMPPRRGRERDDLVRRS